MRNIAAPVPKHEIFARATRGYEMYGPFLVAFFRLIFEPRYVVPSLPIPLFVYLSAVRLLIADLSVVLWDLTIPAHT